MPLSVCFIVHTNTCATVSSCKKRCAGWIRSNEGYSTSKSIARMVTKFTKVTNLAGDAIEFYWINTFEKKPVLTILLRRFALTSQMSMTAG